MFSLVCALQIVVADSVDEKIPSEVRKPVISRIMRKRVESTAIASIGYNKRRHILEIEFVNGAVYRYLAIRPSVYRKLMTADSKAGYYVANIKGKYASVRVRPRTKK